MPSSHVGVMVTPFSRLFQVLNLPFPSFRSPPETVPLAHGHPGWLFSQEMPRRGIELPEFPLCSSGPQPLSYVSSQPTKNRPRSFLSLLSREGILSCCPIFGRFTQEKSLVGYVERPSERVQRGARRPEVATHPEPTVNFPPLGQLFWPQPF